MYKLVPRKPKKKTFTVLITADSNDADYITEVSYFTEKEFKPIAIILKDIQDNFSKSHQLETWSIERYKTLFTKEELNKMDVTIKELMSGAEYLEVPRNDWNYNYCHTLEELEVTCVDENGVIYDIVL